MSPCSYVICRDDARMATQGRIRARERADRVQSYRLVEEQSAVRARGNLPTATSSFVGRHDELAEVRRMESSRRLTLAWPWHADLDDDPAHRRLRTWS